MATYSLLTPVILRQTTANGKLASGCKVYFYQSGTNTPKAIYLDPNGTTQAPNPVIGDSSGWIGPIYGDGYYRMVVCTSTGSQIIPPVDNVIGVGGIGAGTVGGNGSMAMCLTYAEVRLLSASYDFAYVAGRTTDGDGGQGLFQRIPASTLLDDDGIVLVNTGSNVVWKRVFDGVIDPQWFGLKYGSVLSQVVAINKTVGASSLYGLPFIINGSVYIDSSITVTDTASMTVTQLGSFTSPFNTYVTIEGPSTIEGQTFGNNIIPSFSDYYSEVLYSWMGANTDDGKLLQLYQGVQGGTDQTMVIDEVANVTGDLNFSNPIKFVGEGRINCNFGTLGGNIWLYKLIEPDTIRQILSITSTGSVSVNLGDIATRPEWFGAKADGSTNDSTAFNWSIKTGNVLLQDNKTYKLSTQLTYPTTLSISGNGVINLVANTINCTTLSLFNTSILYSGSTNWLNSSNFFAFNGSFPSTYVASSTKVINGCAYSDVAGAPVFDGSPTDYNLHLGDLKSAPALATDANGKIIASSFKKLVMDGMVWSAHNSPRSFYYQDSEHKYPYRKSSGIRYANGRLWFLGYNGYLFSSVNGVYDWSINVGLNAGGTQDSCPNYNNLVYANGWYLASTYRIDGTTQRGLMRSTNGVSWTSANFYDPAYPPGGNSSTRSMYYDTTTSLWLAGDHGGRIITSADNGLTWTAVQIKYYSPGNGQISVSQSFANGFVGKVDDVYVLTDIAGQVYTNNTWGTDNWVRTDVGDVQIYNVFKLDTGKIRMLGTTWASGTSVGAPFSFTCDSLSAGKILSGYIDQMPGYADIDTSYHYVTDTLHYNGMSFIGTASYHVNLDNQGAIYACPDSSNTWVRVPNIINQSGWFTYGNQSGGPNSSFYLAGGNNKVFASVGAGLVLDTH